MPICTFVKGGTGLDLHLSKVWGSEIVNFIFNSTLEFLRNFLDFFYKDIKLSYKCKHCQGDSFEIYLFYR